MHPAPSLVIFTTAAGAGYGLLFLLGISVPFGFLPIERWFGVVAMGMAFGLITIGLAASTYHLGHPERAWRALSQWRSSWLSREGVAALVTYAVAAPFALGWVFWQATGEVMSVLALLTAGSAAVTIACTGMIYASLKTIHQWHTPWVPVLFIAFAMATGCIWLAALVHVFGIGAVWVDWLAAGSLVIAWGLKAGYWRAMRRAAPLSTSESATGLGHLGRVQALEAPHTEDNYLLREMGYRIARKHASRLRILALFFGLGWPLVFLVLGQSGSPTAETIFVCAAAVAASLGVVIARWLFFAEAKHTVGLYYGRP
ncbi:MAG: dimethyl sulfoxide reductase anchor subunit family protein [Alphaproteobacteria bacterium]